MTDHRITDQNTVLQPRGIKQTVIAAILLVAMLFLLPLRITVAQNLEYDALRVLPKVFRAAEAKILPCLVTIESFGGVSAVEGRIGGIRSRGEGNTTGVMISEDGYVITSTFNFITRPPVITVVTADGKRHVANLLGQDNTRKICLLKIDGVTNQPTPNIVAPSKIRVGQWALSVGVGYGDASPALSIGIISAKNRIGERAIQTDANISPANYGGPLIDLQGQLIGICVPLSPNRQTVGAGVEWYDSGIGFSIPLHGAEQLIDRLKKGDSIDPAFLGIRSMTNPSGNGIWVDNVLKSSAAKNAGIKREDIITAIDGQPINHPGELQVALTRRESGQQATFTVAREGEPQPLAIHVTLGSPPPAKGKQKPLAMPLEK